MKPVTAILAKTIRIGPLPYLGLSIVILMLGVVLQLRAANPVMADGSTIFGLFARIGGFVGLFGLVPLFLGVQDEGGSRDRMDGECLLTDRPDGGQLELDETDRSLLESVRDSFPGRTA
jgi:hypothetical protein